MRQNFEGLGATSRFKDRMVEHNLDTGILNRANEINLVWR